MNKFISFDHPIQYFMKPNLIAAVSSLLFLLVPAVAVILAITMRKKYWIAAITIALLSIPINIYLFFNQYSCQGEFCGLSDFFASIIVPTILGTIALIVSLISGPAVIRDKKDRKAARKSFALFLLVICTPIFLILLYIVFSPTHSNVVLIDIQPKIISLNKDNIVHVTTLSTYPFKPTTDIDLSTIRFGPQKAKSIQAIAQDINIDGVHDLVLSFIVNQTGVKPEDTQECLTGKLKNGENIEGCSTVRIIGN